MFFTGILVGEYYYLIKNFVIFVYFMVDNVQGWHGTKMETPWRLYRTKMVNRTCHLH